MEIAVNNCQTPINDELLEQYPEEVIEQFLDFIQNVPFIKWCISPDRPRAKDLPRDEFGRIKVDITKPHIIEDADYFRQPALHYMKHGCYTFLKPNSSPHSEYKKFWAEEIRRCREGYVRESDGEWVTGFCYWFLNYTPMLINKQVGAKKAVRIESFPLFFEGIYWRFHYLWQAREGGKHAIELAKRGAGKAHPYDQQVITPDGIKRWGDIKIGDTLFNERGSITKVSGIPFDDACPIYKITLRDGRTVEASEGHLWNVTIHGRKGSHILSTKELLTLYKKERKVSPRNPTGIEYICSIPSNQGVDFNEQPTSVDPYTFGLLLGDGCFRHGSCYFTQSEQDFLEERPHIPYEVTKWKSKYAYRITIPNWTSILKQYNLWQHKSEDKFIPKEYLFNTREVRLELLRGLMDSDGYINKRRNTYHIQISSKKLIEDIQWLCRSLGYNCEYTCKRTGYKIGDTYKECLPTYTLNIHTTDSIAYLSRKQLASTLSSNYAKSRERGTRIINIEYVGIKKAKCVTVDNPTSLYLIGDFVNTHNSYSLAAILSHNLELGENSESIRRVITVLTAYQKEYLSDSKDGTLSKFKPAINFIWANTPYPRLTLKNSPNDMTWQMGYKDEYGIEKGSLNQVLAVSAKDDSEKIRGKRGWILFEEMGSFKGLLSLYDITRKSVEDGDVAFACMYLVGTSAEDESDFSSAKTLLYSPDGYNILSQENVWDKPRQGKPRFGFFFPSYINRFGCFNADGVSDVVKALLQILMSRYKIKYNSADPKSILRAIAEDPITPAEAIVKVKAAYFPVTQLNERLLQLDSNPQSFSDVWVGDLVFNKNNQVEFKLTADQPIRKFGVSNDTPGAIEIFEMPERNSNGEVFQNRYILGHDPVDNDTADSNSLSSTFVFDLFTDRIVAEYTGRKQFADDNFEIVRKLCLFYNGKCLFESNKKGLYSYMAKYNCTHLLAETPEYLREKQLVKYSSFGSNKYGVNASAAINNYANDLVRQWLLKPTIVMQANEEGQQEPIEIPNMMLVKNRALIEELVAFTPEINVDRIRALGMVMLYREQQQILYQNNLNKDAVEKIEADYLGKDDFFSRNYDRKGLPVFRFNKVNDQ